MIKFTGDQIIVNHVINTHMGRIYCYITKQKSETIKALSEISAKNAK
jgi:hypothetical protein